MKLLILWFGGIAVIVASIAIGLACADVHVVWRIVIGIVMFAVALTIGFRAMRSDPLGPIGLALGIACFILVMAQRTDLLKTHTGEPVTVSVAGGPAHASAAMFHFIDGELLTDRLGSALTYAPGKSYSTKYLTCVAPIVPTGWTESEPVPTWAVVMLEGLTICQAAYFEEAAKAWNRGSRDAVAMDRIDLADGLRAVAEATRRYGLTTARGAPLVTIVPEGIAARAANAEHDVALWIGWATSVWTVVLAAVVVATRRRFASCH